MKTINNYLNKFFNFITTVMIILLLISVIASFQTTFFGKKYNSFFGYTLFEIKTASMAGEMEIGDWILVKITDDVKLNEIITFEQDGSFITHRIIEQYKDTYITKGDSNNAKDTPIKKEQIVGKLVKVMPKFGIIKKTLFNPKVLIILIITILVGSSLFDKKNNQSNKEKENISLKSKKIKKEDNNVEKEENKKIDVEKQIDDKTIEEIEKRFEEQEQLNSKSNEDLNNTATLSKIVVNMNSKTLSSITKTLEDTEVLEVIKEDEIQEVKQKEKAQVLTNKKILLGKNEKNLIKKGIELKENEIIEMVKTILNLETLDGENRAIVNKFINAYIELKYINQGEINSNITLTTFKKNIDSDIQLFANSLIDNKSTESHKKKIDKITNVFILINKLDNNNSNIDKIIDSSKKVNIENPKTTIKELKNIIKQFNNNLNGFYKKLETGKFDLITKLISHTNIYKTNISSNIQFSKLFSDYSIDKTYNNEVIMENLRELQLKMLSLNILKDMFEISYKKKYLISLNDSIFSKEKKIKTILGNIDDIYSQGKINILVDIKTLIVNYNTIYDLSKNGYHFSIELESNDLDEIKNIRKYLCIADYLFIKNNNLTEEETIEKIPSELENKVINIEKTLLEGPVIK